MYFFYTKDADYSMLRFSFYADKLEVLLLKNGRDVAVIYM